MKARDFLLALLVVIVWGANFTVIKLGLAGVPSMLLVALRYSLVAFPALFIVKKPNISGKYIFFYGLTVGVGQFACLFYAMEIGMPAGLASIIVQLQGFISPFLAALIFKETLKPRQIIGFIIAGSGLAIIGLASTNRGIGSIPIESFLLTIMAPLFWSISNLIVRQASNKAQEAGGELKILGLIVWSSLVPPLPALGLALLIDSPRAILGSLTSLSPMSIFSVLYLAYGATLFGYGFWSLLISKYPLGKISPLSLLVPITGLFTARIVLGEELSRLQWIGVFIILIGLVISNMKFKRVKEFYS